MADEGELSGFYVMANGQIEAADVRGCVCPRNGPVWPSTDAAPTHLRSSKETTLCPAAFTLREARTGGRCT